MCSNERRIGSPIGWEELPFQNISRSPIDTTDGFPARILADIRTLGMFS